MADDSKHGPLNRPHKRAAPRERPLDESEERFRQVAEHLDTVFWLYDLASSRTVYVSPQYEQLWGRSAAQLLDNVHAWVETLHPADRERVVAAMAERGDAHYQIEYRIVRPDGSVRWILERGFPVHDEKGDVYRFAGLAEDITAIKETIEELRDTEEKFRQITSLIPQIFWMFDPTFTRTIYISKAYEQIWGRPLGDVYRSPEDFVAGIHPDDLPELMAAMSQVQAAPFPGVEYRVIQPDGSERWVFSRGFPVHDENGAVARVVGISEDITERKALEAERVAAEQRYRRLVENAPYAIYALDEESRFTEINPAGEVMLGRNATDLIGRHISEVVAPEDLGIAVESLRTKITGEIETTDTSFRLMHANGERRLVHIRSTSIRQDGRIVGTQGIARDITEEAARERQLRRAERLASVGTLIGGVAHELNNPLTSIISFAALLAEGDRSPEEREDLETIRREGMRAAKIVSDLRLLARQTQEDPREKAAVDLNDVVRHVLKTRRYVHETRNVEVREDLAESLPPVLGDRAQLEQVALNLVVNAQQAMESADDRLLIVRTRPSGRGVSLSVIDTGVGIPSDELEKIFDPFYTTKAPLQGTGLGLSLVHSIVHEHGGEIHVESQVGRGTAFRVDLPIAVVAPRTPVEAPATTAARPLRILFVDDEPAIRRAVCRFLQRRGHVVDSASEGAEAIEKLDREDDYDVILTDLRMPGVGGDQLIARLREKAGGLDRRVVLMTGDAASSESAALIAATGVPVLFKPLQLDALAARIEQVATERDVRRS